MLQRAIDVDGGALRLFISHAKIDGIPMALSLVAMLRRLREAAGSDGSFEYFYDVEHIPLGARWQKTLEDAATTSLVIALRTDEYENRPWCQLEYLWAESSRMPILVVDLRTEPYHDSARLPFDAAPVVRMHDGNVIRIVLHALASHLRALRIHIQADDNCEVLPHKPSIYSLSTACEALDARNVTADAKVAYPNPRLPADYIGSVRPMLKLASGVEIDLVAYDQM